MPTVSLWLEICYKQFAQFYINQPSAKLEKSIANPLLVERNNEKFEAYFYNQGSIIGYSTICMRLVKGVKTRVGNVNKCDVGFRTEQPTLMLMDVLTSSFHFILFLL